MANCIDYMINDKDLQMLFPVSKSLLENPKFDLVSWYREQLDQNELFEQHYYNAHLKLYCPEPPITPANRCSPNCIHTVQVTCYRKSNKPIVNYFCTPEWEDESQWEGMPDLESISSSETEESSSTSEDDDDKIPPEPLFIEVRDSRVLIE